MAAMGQEQKIIELLNQSVRPTFCILQPLMNCAPYLPLHTAFVEAMKKSVEFSAQQDFVPVEYAALLKHRIGQFAIHRPELHVLAVCLQDVFSQVRQQGLIIIAVID